MKETEQICIFSQLVWGEDTIQIYIFLLALNLNLNNCLWWNNLVSTVPSSITK